MRPMTLSSSRPRSRERDQLGSLGHKHRRAERAPATSNPLGIYAGCPDETAAAPATATDVTQSAVLPIPV